MVERFTQDNDLQLNMEKLELLQHSPITPGVASFDVGDTTISSSSNAICLGVAWSHDLSPTVSISNNRAKARQAFFEQQANSIAYRHHVNYTLSVSFLSACMAQIVGYSQNPFLAH